MVGMLDVMGADLQPAFGELHGVLHVGGSADGAAPDGADRAVHLHAGVGAFFDAPLRFLPVVRQGRAGVGEMVFFFGGDHHQQPVGPDPLSPSAQWPGPRRSREW